MALFCNAAFNAPSEMPGWLCLINAATAAAAGEAMLVPAAHAHPPTLVLNTMSNTQHGLVTGVPRVVATVHGSSVGSAASPPGAATLIAEVPKLVYDAMRSKLVAPSANPTGPVADTAIPDPDCAGTEMKLPE